jgi:hypothetical protein
MWEYFYSAGVAGILRECIFFAGIPSRPALKIFNPTPSRSRGILAGSTGLPFGALEEMLREPPLGLKRRTFLPFLEAEEAVRTKYNSSFPYSYVNDMDFVLKVLVK